MITTLFNKLPAVRRLKSELSAAKAQIETKDKQLAHERGQNNGMLHREAELRDTLAHTKEKRAELQRQFDDLRELTVKQAATIDVLRGQRETDLRLLNEATLAKVEGTSREERFLRTIDTLNATLRDRDAECEDLREDVRRMGERLAEQAPRPALFRRYGGLPDTRIEEILAGKAGTDEALAILQVLDDCTVQAMSEAATAPCETVVEGKEVRQGFTTEQRTFSSGGVFALTRFKERIEDLLATKQEARAA